MFRLFLLLKMLSQYSLCNFYVTASISIIMDCTICIKQHNIDEMPFEAHKRKERVTWLRNCPQTIELRMCMCVKPRVDNKREYPTSL